MHFYNFIIYSIAMSFHCYFTTNFVLGEKKESRSIVPSIEL